MEDFAENVPSNERGKLNILIGILVLTVVSTIASWLASNNEPLYGAITIFSAVGYAVGVLLWCQIDSRERDIPLGPGFRILVLLIAILAVPYYLFQSRGFKKGMISLGFALVFFLLIILVGSITNLILALFDDRLGIFK